MTDTSVNFIATSRKKHQGVKWRGRLAQCGCLTLQQRTEQPFRLPGSANVLVGLRMGCQWIVDHGFVIGPFIRNADEDVGAPGGDERTRKDSQSPKSNRIGRLARSLVHPLVGTLSLALATITTATPPAAPPPPTADQMRAFILQRPEQDMIHWKDPTRGNSLEVRILEVSDAGIRVQKTLLSGLTDRVLPLAEISGVSFGRTSLEHRLVHHPTPDAVDALRLLWNLRSASIDMEGSNVADIGIALAKALRMTGGTGPFAESEKLLRDIREKQVGEIRKNAIDNELRTLELARAIESGPPEETDRIAWQITEIEADVETMLMATAWLGERHFEDLKQLEEDHPRWQLDDEVRPIRARLYHLSLDFSLYPSLFHGTHTEAAAAGLLRAWHVYKHTHAPELELRILEDLAALYPDSQAARDTAAELARLRARQQAGTLVEEIPEQTPTEESEDDPEEADSESTLPTPPPQPKRYNIFDD